MVEVGHVRRKRVSQKLSGWNRRSQRRRCSEIYRKMRNGEEVMNECKGDIGPHFIGLNKTQTSKDNFFSHTPSQFLKIFYLSSIHEHLKISHIHFVECVEGETCLHHFENFEEH
jgi:hypothetical protein